MKILALDTSGQHASAAIVTDNIVICEISLNARHGEKAYTHSEILMPSVARLFEMTGQKIEELTHVAYTCGPGSFTGLRIGASTALGLARALDICAIAVPTLDALAFNVIGMGYKWDVCALMDARRGQFYFAVFDKSFTKITDYEALPANEIASKLRGNTLFVGDGTALMQIKSENAAFDFAHAHHNFVRASSVGLWACKNSDVQNEKMIYVRPPQAVREANNGNHKLA